MLKGKGRGGLCEHTAYILINQQKKLKTHFTEIFLLKILKTKILTISIGMLFTFSKNLQQDVF